MNWILEVGCSIKSTMDLKNRQKYIYLWLKINVFVFMFWQHNQHWGHTSQAWPVCPPSAWLEYNYPVPTAAPYWSDYQPSHLTGFRQVTPILKERWVGLGGYWLVNLLHQNGSNKSHPVPTKTVVLNRKLKSFGNWKGIQMFVKVKWRWQMNRFHLWLIFI